MRPLQYCEFVNFVSHLGIDPSADGNDLVIVAAQGMFSAPLPPNWSEQLDAENSRVYFYNSLTDESLWVHPQEVLFKELVEEVKLWRPDEPVEKLFGRCETHLRQAHKLTIESLSQWAGPYDAPPSGPEEAPEDRETASQFFYNAATGESIWADPRLAAEHDLRQRHAILSSCLAAQTQSLARLSNADSSDEEDVQAFVHSLWESLGALPRPARDGLSAEASPPASLGVGGSPAPSARRPSHLLGDGKDTVRSSISYLSARSSCSPR